MSLAARSRNPYFAVVKQNRAPLFAAIGFLTTAFNAFSAEQSWAGEYADKKFLNGKAVFEMSVKQSGNTIQISFDAVYNDGHGVAPEGQGPAKITSAGKLEFKWEDSFKNSGTGTIERAGDNIVVSMKATRVVDSRCLAFCGENLLLQRLK